MKKLTSIILSLLLVLVLTSVQGTQGAFAQEVGDQQTVASCEPSEKIAWAWGLLDITVEAPDFIYFLWPDGTEEQAAFYDYDPVNKVAFYRTTNNLNIEPDGWYSDEASIDQLADLYYQCPPAEPTATPTPTATATPTAVPTATIAPTVVPTVANTPTPTPTNGITPTVTIEPTSAPQITPTPSTGSGPTAAPTVTTNPTSPVTPTVAVTAVLTQTPNPTQEPTRTLEEPSFTPTPTQEHHEESTVTPTATSNPGPTATPTPSSTSNGVGGQSIAQILGATTMAKTGSFDQLVMNISGIFGMLFTAAGSLIYAKKRNKIKRFVK